MLSRLVLVFAPFAGAAIAQDRQYVSLDGDLYGYEQNIHGAVLTPVDGVSPVVPPNNAEENATEVIYLGRSCDAFSEALGEGVWNQRDGGFVVEFPETQIAFPGQSIDVDDRGRCRA